MPIQQSDNPQLTPRETQTMAYEKEMWEKQAEYNLEIAKIETRWNALLRLPSIIIKLPVYCLLALAYIAHAIRGTNPDERFWNFLSK